MKRAMIIISILLSLILILASCASQSVQTSSSESVTSQSTVPSTTQQEAVKKKIVYAAYDMQYAYFQQQYKGIEAKCKELGYEAVLLDEKSDENIMISGCLDFINQGVAGLIVAPFKPEALGPVAEAAKEKGIPFVIADIGHGEYPYTAYVVSQNVQGGFDAGEFMIATLLKEGKTGSQEVAIIRNDPSAHDVWARGDGFKQAVEEAGWKVVVDSSASQGHGEPAYKEAAQIIDAHPNIVGFFCTNDVGGLAIMQACIDKGRKDIKIIGYNCEENAIKAIEDGTYLASVLQLPYQAALTHVTIVDKALKGETITFDIPESRTIYVPVKLINLENIQVAKDAWK